MKAFALSLRYDGLRWLEGGAWRLLAADTAPLILGLLRALFPDQGMKLGRQTLQDRLAVELEELATNGRYTDKEGEVRSPEDSVRRLVSDGWLVRRLIAESTEEEFELSGQAMFVFRFVDGLEAARPVLTESKLAAVIEKTQRLATESEEDPKKRVEYLEEEINRIRAEIQRVEIGKSVTVDEQVGLQVVRELIADIADIRSFGTVIEGFEVVARKARELITEQGRNASQADIISDIYAGKDVVMSTPEGQSWDGFYALLSDPERRESFDRSLALILTRSFTKSLSKQERTDLVRAIERMQEGAARVETTHIKLTTGINQLVKSKKYKENRQMREVIFRAQRAAKELVEIIHPSRSTGFEMAFTTVTVQSPTRHRLWDPSANIVDTTMKVAESRMAGAEDIAALMNGSREISFSLLKRRIGDALLRSPIVSVGELMAAAEDQNLVELVGYLMLAGELRTIQEGHEARLSFRSASGMELKAATRIIEGEVETATLRFSDGEEQKVRLGKYVFMRRT